MVIASPVCPWPIGWTFTIVTDKAVPLPLGEKGGRESGEPHGMFDVHNTQHVQIPGQPPSEELP